MFLFKWEPKKPLNSVQDKLMDSFSLTSGVHEHLPPPVQTWFAFQTSALRSTSWNWQRNQTVVKTHQCLNVWICVGTNEPHKHTVPTGGQRDSLPRCPDSHVGYQQSGTVQTCGWSPCPGLTPTHLGLPSPCRPHYGNGITQLNVHPTYSQRHKSCR